MLISALLSAALLVLPPRCAAGRLRALVAVEERSARVRLPRPGAPVVAVVLALAGWLVAGPGVAVGGGAVGAACWWRWRQRDRLRRAAAATAGLARALRTLTGELRIGAHPAAAAEAAADDAPPEVADAMRSLAVAARLGGDVAGAVAAGDQVPALAPGLRQLGTAWRLADRHGLPLADVLDAVRGDVDQRARFARQTQARMAGPRATATVLATLPLLGLALGEAMGAHPVSVLFTTGFGQVLVAVGGVLTCAGLLWSARITGQVAR
ncbi:tight adherence protein B [Herbihabitans rhizosphaerae]|uniref:Tight adherence protein B n=1 Tax=Herbihabitans rhizosphaerae TaxID=1872711 RepID=A0A4Q7KW36_9PSEU|nr:type II secretion system F family protein [Herbihabitans rhizosphaerae]RZS41259.1 tight adherence protein B [Herbihabitans rhizosphaerae]